MSVKINIIVVFAFSFCLAFSLNAKEIPIEAFAQGSDVLNVTLSPSGKHIAYIARVDTEDKSGSIISVVNVDTKERQNYGFTDNSSFKYLGLDWLNSKTIRVVISYPVLVGENTSFEKRMYKLDIETGDFDDLVPNSLFSKTGNWKPSYYGYIVDKIDADPDRFLFGTTTSKSYGHEVYLISLKGDEPVLVQKGINRYYSWMADEQSRVRLAMVSRGRDRTRIMERGINDTSFRPLWEFDMDADDQVIPIGFDFDPNILFIKAKQHDRWKIFKVDLRDENLTRTLVYDNPDDKPLGTIRYSAAKKKAVGVYKGAGEGFIFWDDETEKLYKSINKALPDHNNYFYGLSRDENRLLVFSSSDIESGAYYVWDRTTKMLDLLAFRKEALTPALMTKQEHTSFQNRDGLELPVIYTFPEKPPQKKPTLIVLPSMPGYLFVKGFYTRAQFLANRGYNVAHLNLREPDSKDDKYRESGIVGWGQDTIKDLEDLAKELAKNDAVDANNICILGGRYGGTIALTAAALAEFPFKCVISMGGITDFKKFLKYKRNYLGYVHHSRAIGDKIRYSIKYSPAELVEKIKIPVLLVHGEIDKMVEADQSETLYRSLEANSAPVSYVEIEGADHNFDKDGETAQLYETIETFLADVVKE